MEFQVLTGPPLIILAGTEAVPFDFSPHGLHGHHSGGMAGKFPTILQVSSDTTIAGRDRACHYCRWVRMKILASQLSFFLIPSLPAFHPGRKGSLGCFVAYWGEQKFTLSLGSAGKDGGTTIISVVFGQTRTIIV